MRTISTEKFLEVIHTISDHEGLETYTAITNRSHHFIGQLMSHTAVTRILEIGFGAGHMSMMLLNEKPSIHLTSIDKGENEYTTQSMDLVHGNFMNRFVGKIADSSTYSMEDDPEKDNYEMVVIDADRSTVHAIEHDLELANQTKADWILLAHTTDTVVSTAVDNFLLNNLDGWRWHRTVQWEKMPTKRDDGFQDTYVVTGFLLNKWRTDDD